MVRMMVVIMIMFLMTFLLRARTIISNRIRNFSIFIVVKISIVVYNLVLLPSIFFFKLFLRGFIIGIKWGCILLIFFCLRVEVFFSNLICIFCVFFEFRFRNIIQMIKDPTQHFLTVDFISVAILHMRMPHKVGQLIWNNDPVRIF